MKGKSMVLLFDDNDEVDGRSIYFFDCNSEDILIDRQPFYSKKMKRNARNFGIGLSPILTIFFRSFDEILVNASAMSIWIIGILEFIAVILALNFAQRNRLSKVEVYKVEESEKRKYIKALLRKNREWRIAMLGLFILLMIGTKVLYKDYINENTLKDLISTHFFILVSSCLLSLWNPIGNLRLWWYLKHADRKPKTRKPKAIKPKKTPKTHKPKAIKPKKTSPKKNRVPKEYGMIRFYTGLNNEGIELAYYLDKETEIVYTERPVEKQKGHSRGRMRIIIIVLYFAKSMAYGTRGEAHSLLVTKFIVANLAWFLAISIRFLISASNLGRTEDKEDWERVRSEGTVVNLSKEEIKQMYNVKSKNAKDMLLLGVPVIVSSISVGYGIAFASTENILGIICGVTGLILLRVAQTIRRKHTKDNTVIEDL
jgi:hypothetical protein